uniref:Uncharacterized protein n=1 Tax=Labrus bergylta TaxID=56723 RepID=A0A3Q3GJI3_9LABR
VLAATCLSMSAAMLSDISPSPTCFSTSRIVSSECPSFALFACVTAFVLTFLSESLALLLNCFASLVRFSLCSRVTLHRKNLDVCVLVALALCVRVCVCVCVRLTSGKLLIAPKQTQIHVLMLRLRVKSSLSALRTAVMSCLTSSRLMMSSTRAELIFTLADWPFALW